MTSESSAPATKEWMPPAHIEDLFAKSAGNKWASINSPVAGARAEKPLEEGEAPLQLYSLATPNGQKVAIMLEELGVEYDAHLINIGSGDQFNSGFVHINPNSKIPALVDRNGPENAPISLFESASIVYYLAEKYNRFLPTNPRDLLEARNWIFWQMSAQGPFTGQFGHFFVYAPSDQIETRDYGVARYGMEVQRLCSVLNQHLQGREYMVADTYSIVDMLLFPWFHQLRIGYKHAPSGIAANEFLNIDQYEHAIQWDNRMMQREAVQRGLQVCHWQLGVKPWLVNKENKDEK